MRKKVEELLSSDISAYKIGKESGVDPSSIQRLRSGDRSLDNMSFMIVEKLYNYAKEVLK